MPLSFPVRLALPFALAALSWATPVQADPQLEKGLAGAMRGCEEWILNPLSWIDGDAPFLSAVGLGSSMHPVTRATVHDMQLPPKPMRAGNRYWRIDSTPTAGFMLIVSDQLPMCHVTGGGSTDLQPTIETFLASKNFTSQWKPVEERVSGDMRSTLFRHWIHGAFSLVVSRANSAGLRLDRVQLIITGSYHTE